MRNPTLSAAHKRAVQTEHIHTYGRALFMCHECWLPPTFCTCSQMGRVVPNTKVVVHMHHNEWCACSHVIRSLQSCSLTQYRSDDINGELQVPCSAYQLHWQSNLCAGQERATQAASLQQRSTEVICS